MKKDNYSCELKFLLKLVKNAEHYVLKNKENVQISAKGDNDIVTNLDYGIEQYFTDEIHRAYPGFSIVSEEFNPDALLSQNCFIFDPIDGTSAFAHNLGTWGIQIAMIKGGKLVASVISIPSLKERYCATLGGGAFLNGEPIHVSNEPYDKCYYALIGKRDKFNVLSTFHVVNPFYKDFASISYSMGLVARGSLGGLAFYRNYIWDIAPGTLICKEAGAKIYNIDGRGIIIANTDDLLSQLKEHSLMALNNQKA